MFETPDDDHITRAVSSQPNFAPQLMKQFDSTLDDEDEGAIRIAIEGISIDRLPKRADAGKAFRGLSGESGVINATVILMLKTAIHRRVPRMS